MSSHFHLAVNTLISTPSGILSLIQQVFFFFQSNYALFLIYCPVVCYHTSPASSLPLGSSNAHAELHTIIGRYWKRTRHMCGLRHIIHMVLCTRFVYVLYTYFVYLYVLYTHFGDDLREWVAEISWKTRSFEEDISRYLKTRIW